MEVINTCLRAGQWHAELIHAGSDLPEVTITHQGDALDGVDLQQTDEAGHWALSVPIPAELINDGVQTFVLQGPAGETLTHFSLVCGAPLAEDLRDEIALMRAELSLLQRAFRKHCAET